MQKIQTKNHKWVKDILLGETIQVCHRCYYEIRGKNYALACIRCGSVFKEKDKGKDEGVKKPLSL